MGKKKRGLINKTIAERLIANNMDQPAVHREGFSRSSIWRVAQRMDKGETPDEFIYRRPSKKRVVDEGERVLQEALAQQDDGDELDPDSDEVRRPSTFAHEQGKKALEEVFAKYEAEEEKSDQEEMLNPDKVRKRKIIPLAGISSRRVSTVFKIANDEIVLEPDDLFESYFLYKQLMATTEADNTFSDMIKAGLEVLWSLAQRPPAPPEEELALTGG